MNNLSMRVKPMIKILDSIYNRWMCDKIGIRRALEEAYAEGQESMISAQKEVMEGVPSVPRPNPDTPVANIAKGLQKNKPKRKFYNKK